MSLTFIEREFRALGCAAWAVFLIAATCRPAQAQPSGLGDALLALWNDKSTTANGVRVVNGSLFGATIDFTVRNLSGGNEFNPRKLESTDRITRFVIRRGNQQLEYEVPAGGATPEQFSAFVRANAPTLAEYLFPTSVSESVSSKDAAQNHAQQFLFNTALAIAAAQRTDRPSRAGSGGLFEFENLTGDGRSTLAFQGRYNIEGARLSLIGRYSQQQEGVRSQSTLAPLTRSLAFATDFHPSVSINEAVDLRIGIDARTGLLMTSASSISFGSIDYGGGVWMSARKDFSRVRLGAGSLLQGSKSYIPGSINGDLQSLADMINRKDVAWDHSYGALGGFALTNRTSLNAKFLQTRPVEVGVEARGPWTTIVMGSVSHLVGGLTPVDIGYKYTTAGGLRAHGVFVQGNYGW
jgi:hypothetical protein